MNCESCKRDTTLADHRGLCPGCAELADKPSATVARIVEFLRDKAKQKANSVEDYEAGQYDAYDYAADFIEQHFGHV